MSEGTHDVATMRSLMKTAEASNMLAEEATRKVVEVMQEKLALSTENRRISALRDGLMDAWLKSEADNDDLRIENRRLREALEGVVKHWDEFGDMIVLNNTVNRDDYDFQERIEIARAALSPAEKGEA